MLVADPTSQGESAAPDSWVVDSSAVLGAADLAWAVCTADGAVVAASQVAAALLGQPQLVGSDIEALFGGALSLGGGAGDDTAYVDGKQVRVRQRPYDVEGRVLLLLEDETAKAAYFHELLRVTSGVANGDLQCLAEPEAHPDEYAGQLMILNQVVQAVSDPIAQVTHTLQSLAAGEIPSPMDGMFLGDFETLANSLNTLIAASRDVVEIATRIADGDLSVSIEPRGDGDELLGALGRMVSDLNQVFREVRESGTKLDDGSERMLGVSEALSSNASSSAVGLKEIAATVEQIRTQTVENESHATNAMSLSAEARDSASAGDAHMSDMVQSMTEIHEASKSISKIIKVIDDIAFQTNLLALNAAVEAGRAGEHGRGFAVVAEEVRRLAARSASAAKETGEIIEMSSSKVARGLEIADLTAKSLSDIVLHVRKVNELVGEIGGASSEQANSISEIHTALSGIDAVTQQATGQSEELATAARALAGQATSLQSRLQRFRLTEPAAMPAWGTNLSPDVLQAVARYMEAKGPR